MAALTLALGVGVNSAIFSLVDAALMKPLPFGQMDRLVMLWERTPTSPKTGVAPLNMRDWNLQSQSFDGIAYNCSSSPSLSVSVASGLSRKAAAVASS